MAKFTVVTGQQIRKSLARRFVPLGDSLRNLLTKFGLRTYRVTLVTVQWSGGERGVGTPVVIKEEMVLPTPKLSDLSGITEIVQPVGLDEVGQLFVSQISGRFTEDQLMGRASDGSDIAHDTEFFWEIEFPSPDDGAPGEKRRFFPRGVPKYEPGRLAWTVRLEKSHEDRTRGGDPE